MSLSAKDRALRIELLRARAALERQSLVRGAHKLGDSLKPSNLVRGLFSRRGGTGGPSRARPSDWLSQGLALTRRYPLLASGVSAVVARAGKRNRLIRAGATLWLGWQFLRSVRHRKDRLTRIS